MEKRKDKEMLLQSTYNYEALTTVMINAFGKGGAKWRTKTLSEEWEESKIADAESIKVQKRYEHGLEMRTLRANFLIAKENGNL